MTDLSPCPCCDGPAAFGNPPLGHQIYCLSMKCGTQSGIFPTKPMARNAWSKRASPAATPMQPHLEPKTVSARLLKAITTATNDDVSEPMSEKRLRHTERVSTMYVAIDCIAALAAAPQAQEGDGK